jgi:hypothetical protein
MVMLKNLSLIALALMAIFSGTNCFENPLLKKLKKEAPVLAKQETLLGSTSFFAGLPLAHIGSKKYTLPRRMLFRYPGLVLMGIGMGSIANSFNQEYKWIK